MGCEEILLECQLDEKQSLNKISVFEVPQYLILY